MIKHSFLFTIFFFLFIFGFAQQDPYPYWKDYSEEYPFCGTVSGSFFSKEGSIWFSSSNKIYKWSPYEEDTNIYSSSNSFFTGFAHRRNVVVDSNENIWVASKEHIVKFDKEGRVTYDSSFVAPYVETVDHIDRSDLNKELVNEIVRDVEKLVLDAQDRLWVKTMTRGCFFFNGNDWKYFNKSTPPDALFLPDQRGGIWTSSRSSSLMVHHLSDNGEVDQSLSWDSLGFHFKYDPRINAGTYDAEENLWIAGSQGHYLFKFNGDQWTEELSYKGDEKPPFSYLKDLTVGPEGQIWASVDNGLAKFTGNGWEHFKIGHEEPGKDTVSTFPKLAVGQKGYFYVIEQVSDTSGRTSKSIGGAVHRFDGQESSTYFEGWRTNVSSMAFDNKGALWVALGRSSQELLKLENGGRKRYSTRTASFPGKWVYSIKRDDQGNIWARTDNGMALFDGEKWEQILKAPEEQEASFIPFYPESEEKVWVGRKGKDISFYNKDKGQWKEFGGKVGSRTHYRFKKGPNGAMWFMGRDYLAKYQNGEWEEFVPENSGIPEGIVTNIGFSDPGELWVGHQRGLLKFDGDDWEQFSTENSGLPIRSVRVLAVDEKGRVWMGFDRLCMYNGDEWKTFTPENSGIPSVERIKDLQVGPKGYLWIGTKHGVFRYDPSGERE